MAAFAVRRDTPLPPADAWSRVTDWPAHARHVPFTRIALSTPPPSGPGTVFVARTGGRRLGFDDPMAVVDWDPPRFCRLEKRGPVMLGWAEITVEPHGAGSTVTWREHAVPARLPRALYPVASVAGRLIFGRVLRGLLRRP